MSDETIPGNTEHRTRSRNNAALAKSVDELGVTVERQGITVFQSVHRIDESIARGTVRMDSLDSRVTVLEHGALNRDEVKGAVKSALQEEGVVTQDTLGTTAYRQIVGGTKRMLIILGLLSAGFGGAAVVIQHIVQWVFH